MAVARPVIRFLTTKQVNQLHTTYVNPGGQPTNALLESAVQSPANHKHYTGENDVVMLTGILGYKLIQNHPYGDGNKRTALLSVQAFLKINGKTLEEADTAGNKILADAHVAVATGQCNETQLAEQYRLLVKDYKDLTQEVVQIGENAVEG